MTVKQLGFACCQVVQKPFALSFHVPLFFWPDSARGLTGHLAVRRKRHSEFGAARCRGSEGLAVEESCLDVARSHRLSREGSARSEENPYDSQWSCIATFHSITSSARASTLAGISMPSAFAVLRLIASSNLVGACTGRSAGFSPLRMRST